MDLASKHLLALVPLSGEVGRKLATYLNIRIDGDEITEGEVDREPEKEAVIDEPLEPDPLGGDAKEQEKSNWKDPVDLSEFKD